MKLNRRKTLLGLGAAAGGGGIVFGSGAFTQVQADRDVTIGIDSDSEALLALKANDDVTSVFEDEESGELVIDTDELSDDDEGFNVGSTVTIGRIETGSGDFGTVVEGEEAFKVVNNFDEVGGGEDGALDVEIDASDINDPEVDPEEDDQHQLIFTITHRDEDDNVITDDLDFSAAKEGSIAIGNVESGDQLDVAIGLLTGNAHAPDELSGDIIFAAEPASGEFIEPATPVRNTSREPASEYQTLSAAVADAGDSETLELGDATYTDRVTIENDGLTIEAAADEASPTVDGQGEIPVLVDGADGVTVDPHDDIEFLSGIDVGADFSDYPAEPVADRGLTVDVTVGAEAEFKSIGAALNGKGADTTILVESDYDASNEDSDNAGSSSALISIVHENVEVISEEGPEETVIDERPDAGGDGRAVDINAANVVFQGFDVADAAQEGIVVTGVEDAEGIEITDNKVTSSNDGILVSEYGPEGFESASTDQILIANNEVHSDRIGISVSDGADEPVIENNTVTGENANAIQVSDEAEDAVVEGNLSAGDNRDDLVVTGSVQKSVNNHFVSNDRYAVRLTTEGTLNVANNWFGTEDRSTIEDRIEEEESGGEVTFDPFAGAPVDPDAGDDSDN
ncbi:hypothetical protein JCM18237_22560 [Halorubrum luteum]